MKSTLQLASLAAAMLGALGSGTPGLAQELKEVPITSVPSPPRARPAPGSGSSASPHRGNSADAAAPAQGHSRHAQRRYGMMAAGISLLAAGYLAALVAGSVYLAAEARTKDFGSSEAVGCYRTSTGLLLVPVAGPFFSGVVAPTCFYNSGVLLYWSLPWIVLDGAAQVAGLTLTIVGARRRRPQTVNPGSAGLQLRIAPMLGAGTLAFSGTF